MYTHTHKFYIVKCTLTLYKRKKTNPRTYTFVTTFTMFQHFKFLIAISHVKCSEKDK